MGAVGETRNNLEAPQSGVEPSGGFLWRGKMMFLNKPGGGVSPDTPAE